MARFVMQQHDATTRHFDFRIEVDGVLRSWAVPRGPSLDPSDKRLAVPVEDHSMQAGEFEGVHEGARRGTGAVIIWDRGTYRCPPERDGAASIAEALDRGHAVLELDGEKLHGRWALTRVADDRWILVKARDEFADRARDILAERPESVVSGRTLDQIV